MTHLLPELGSDGLVLWRLRRSSARRLWCSVGEFGDEYLLVVRDPVTHWTSIAEIHDDIRPLVRRAMALRNQYLSAGWRRIELEEAHTVH